MLAARRSWHVRKNLGHRALFFLYACARSAPEAILANSCWGLLGTHLTANARRSEAGAVVVGQDGHGAQAAPTPDDQLRRDPTRGRDFSSASVKCYRHHAVDVSKKARFIDQANILLVLLGKIGKIGKLWKISENRKNQKKLQKIIHQSSRKKCIFSIFSKMAKTRS